MKFLLENEKIDTIVKDVSEDYLDESLGLKEKSSGEVETEDDAQDPEMEQAENISHLIFDNYYGNKSVEELDVESINDIDHYYTLIKDVDEAERFNYHSDYWGYDEDYQEQNVDLIDNLTPYINKRVEIDYEDGSITGKLLGIAIDRQYNSISHTKVILDSIEELNEALQKAQTEEEKQAIEKEIEEVDAKIDYADDHGMSKDHLIDEIDALNESEIGDKMARDYITDKDINYELDKQNERDVKLELAKQGIATNESLESYIYLFPELTYEDKEQLDNYNLTLLGKNRFEDEVNSVVKGSKEDLEFYAKDYLAYELHPDYLYVEDDFAGEIEPDMFEDFDIEGDVDFTIETPNKLTIEDVKEIAMEHYEDGGDVVIETMTDEDIQNWIEQDGTRDGLMNMFRDNLSIYQDRKAREYDDYHYEPEIEVSETEEDVVEPGEIIDDPLLPDEFEYDDDISDFGPGNPWDAPGMNVKDFLR